MNRFLSQKLRFYSFICIALLLFVHAYNLQETYLQPFSLVDEPTTFTTFFEYYFANGLLRFRIPLLFIISGYIFSLQDRRPYWGRIQKRFKTLLVPFFIWSALGLLMTYLWQQYPITAEAVYASQIDQFGDNRPYSEFGFMDILQRWLIAPVSFQLWFIRSLFFYNMLYPLFKKVVMKFPLAWFILLFILTILKTGFFIIEAQGMLFFTLGIWISKSQLPLDRKPVWCSTTLCWLIFCGLAFIKTWMAFEFEDLNFQNAFIMSVLHYISVTTGIMAVWFSGDKIVSWCMSRQWFVWATSFAFIIYALHVPILPYVTRLFYMMLDGFRYYRLFTFFAAPVLVFFFCLAAGAIWRRLWPSGYRLATGGRGF